MHLTLSSRHPRNSFYSTETGQILYKVDKPRASGSGTATIRKAVNTINGIWDGNLESNIQSTAPHPSNQAPVATGAVVENTSDCSISSAEELDSGRGENASTAQEGHFAFYAQVEFHSVSSSRFRYNNLDVPVDKYFRKGGWSSYGKERVFTAADGEEYRWHLGGTHLEMYKNDGGERPLVKFRDYWLSLGPFTKGRPASLEVDDSCVPILDEIMMTFIYCQKLRKDRLYASIA